MIFITCYKSDCDLSLIWNTLQDTEQLMEQLAQDQEAVDQVREIVASEEAVMQRETQAVQNYADVSKRWKRKQLAVL